MRSQQAINNLQLITNQKYTSKNTCINIVPSLFKKVKWRSGTCNLDYGGGKYETTTLFLAMQGVKNKVYDPYNRTYSHNKEILEYVYSHGIDTVTLSNVLNVIKEKELRNYVIRECYNILYLDSFLYIKVYEGNKSGIGKETKKGWQENRRLKTYIEEIECAITKQHGFQYKVINNIIVIFYETFKDKALNSIV